MKKITNKLVEETIQYNLQKKFGKAIILPVVHVYETGHSINIAHFKLQYDKNMGMGTHYNPSNILLKNTSFLTQYTLAKASNDDVATIFAEGKVPLSDRLDLFNPLSKLVTRALGNLNATEASAQLKANAKTFADVIRGVHHAPAVPAVPPAVTPDTISNSHMSFINRANNFRAFISLLNAISFYNPSEADLKIISMTTLLGKMDTANTDIGATVITPIENARNTRNHLLYNPGTGLVDLALKSKNYVKSVFGATSAEFTSVSKIKYTRPKK